MNLLQAQWKKMTKVQTINYFIAVPRKTLQLKKVLSFNVVTQLILSGKPEFADLQWIINQRYIFKDTGRVKGF